MRAIILFLLLAQSIAFVVVPTAQLNRMQTLPPFDNGFATNRDIGRPYCTSARKRQTRLQGLFGLGFGELIIVVLALGFVLGPDKIISFIRSSGSTAKEFKDELSKVPEEFKKGLEEGEIEARSRKAKKIDAVEDDKE